MTATATNQQLRQPQSNNRDSHNPTTMTATNQQLRQPQSMIMTATNQ